MTVRAKFQLVAVVDHVSGAKTLKFETRYDSAIPEDQRFTTATPWGSIEMQVNNPVALGQFNLGENYYADFVEAG